MNLLEAIILGLVQGFTEFLPVSSSGHLAIGQQILGITPPGVSFDVVVHTATVLSTLVVFRKDITALLAGLFKFRKNEETIYVLNIIVSMIPVAIVGLFFKDYVETLFGSGLLIVGFSLIATAVVLYLSGVVKSGDKPVTTMKAFIIGIAQAVAVLPGLSRSGSTISAGLLLGVKKDEIAKFSFLMVLVPVLGEAFLNLVSGDNFAVESIGALPLFAAFAAAFVSGLIACKAMITLVKKVKLNGFAVYCAVIGLLCIIYSIF